jgi:ATP-dependent Zn protease
VQRRNKEIVEFLKTEKYTNLGGKIKGALLVGLLEQEKPY